MTTILCMAWAIVPDSTPAEQADVKLWLPNEPFPNELRVAIEDRQNLVVAHNAIFERAVFANIGIPRFGFPTVEAHQWRCTLAKAAMHGLPKGLSECGKALGLKVVKDYAGKRVMLKLSKYTDKISKNNPMGMHEKWEDYETLYAYCIQDVYSEIAIDHALRDLPEREQQVWHLDQKMNIAGVHVDRQSANIIVGQIEQLNDRLMLELAQLTSGEVASVKQSVKLRTWLSRESGVILSSVDKEAIDQLLSHKELPAHVKRVAEIRQALGRSSVSKYRAILNTTTDHDPYVRDFLQYHSASTGRWGGRIVQFQNLPQGSIKNMDAAITDIVEMGLEGIEIWYPDPMAMYAGAIRGMVCASQGFDLVAADYNAIEPRVLFWLSDDSKGLEIYRTHEKIYEYMAADIYGTTPDAIGKDSMERFLGKTAVIGCGYGIGAQKFMEACHKRKVLIDLDLAERAVKQYRQTFEGVPRLWYHMEDCARHAIKNPGAIVPCANGKIHWMKRGDFLYAKLPAGRFLAYHKPKVVLREKWGQMRETITYWGVRSTDMGVPKYCEVETYGGRLVENSVQAISRDIMADAMLRLDASKKYTPVLSVHDEAISTVAEGTGDVQEYCDLLTQKEPWAKDIPLKAAGWIGKRYRK